MAKASMAKGATKMVSSGKELAARSLFVPMSVLELLAKDNDKAVWTWSQQLGKKGVSIFDLNFLWLRPNGEEVSGGLLLLMTERRAWKTLVAFVRFALYERHPCGQQWTEIFLRGLDNPDLTDIPFQEWIALAVIKPDCHEGAKQLVAMASAKVLGPNACKAMHESGMKYLTAKEAQELEAVVSSVAPVDGVGQARRL